MLSYSIAMCSECEHDCYIYFEFLNFQDSGDGVCNASL